MGFLNLSLSTIIYPQIHASKAQESFKNARTDEGKGSTLLFLLQGSGWVGRINQHCTATGVLVYTEVRRAQKQR